MSLGLIFINEDEDIKHSINCLQTNKDTWLTACKSYIIYAKQKKEDVLELLKNDQEILSATYDVTSDEQLAVRCFKHFNALIEVDGPNVHVESFK